MYLNICLLFNVSIRKHIYVLVFDNSFQGSIYIRVTDLLNLQK